MAHNTVFTPSAPENFLTRQIQVSRDTGKTNINFRAKPSH